MLFDLWRELYPRLSEVIIHFGDAFIAIFNNEFESILV